MAIKYYSNPKTKQTIAVLNGCQFDALNKIDKFMNGFDWCWCTKKYLMNDTYRAVVRCSAEDEFSEEKGREYAKAKLMKKYYKDFDRRIDMFRSDLIQLNSRVFETSDEVKNNA